MLKICGETRVSAEERRLPPQLTLSQFSISISTTTLANLMSKIPDMDSSSGLRSVGPKQTLRFETVIRFLSLWQATLEARSGGLEVQGDAKTHLCK